MQTKFGIFCLQTKVGKFGKQTKFSAFANTSPVKLGGETPSRIRAWSLIRNKNQLFSLRDTAMQLRGQRPLHVQGVAGHPS
jgi:hypothetical protein